MYIELGLSFAIGVILFFLLNTIFKLSKSTQNKVLLIFILGLCIILAFCLTRMTSLFLAMLNNDNYLAVNNIVAEVDNSNNILNETNVNDVEEETNQEKDAIREDLLNYINNELPKLFELDEKVIRDYDNISIVNYIDDETMYYAIKDEIIPLQLNLIEVSKNIIPNTEKVKALHENANMVFDIRLYGFNTMLSALETQDVEKVNLANEKLDSIVNEIKNFHVNIKELADNYDINYNSDYLMEDY